MASKPTEKPIGGARGRSCYYIAAFAAPENADLTNLGMASIEWREMRFDPLSGFYTIFACQSVIDPEKNSRVFSQNQIGEKDSQGKIKSLPFAAASEEILIYESGMRELQQAQPVSDEQISDSHITFFKTPHIHHYALMNGWIPDTRGKIHRLVAGCPVSDGEFDAALLYMAQDLFNQKLAAWNNQSGAVFQGLEMTYAIYEERFKNIAHMDEAILWQLKETLELLRDTSKSLHNICASDEEPKGKHDAYFDAIYKFDKKLGRELPHYEAHKYLMKMAVQTVDESLNANIRYLLDMFYAMSLFGCGQQRIQYKAWKQSRETNFRMLPKGTGEMLSAIVVADTSHTGDPARYIDGVVTKLKGVGYTPSLLNILRKYEQAAQTSGAKFPYPKILSESFGELADYVEQAIHYKRHLTAQGFQVHPKPKIPTIPTP